MRTLGLELDLHPKQAREVGVEPRELLVVPRTSNQDHEHVQVDGARAKHRRGHERAASGEIVDGHTTIAERAHQAAPDLGARDDVLDAEHEHAARGLEERPDADPAPRRREVRAAPLALDVPKEPLLGRVGLDDDRRLVLVGARQEHLDAKEFAPGVLADRAGVGREQIRPDPLDVRRELVEPRERALEALAEARLRLVERLADPRRRGLLLERAPAAAVVDAELSELPRRRVDRGLEATARPIQAAPRPPCEEGE